MLITKEWVVNHNRRFQGLLALCLLTLSACGELTPNKKESVDFKPLLQAESYLKQHQYLDALQQAQLFYAQNPDSAPALEILLTVRLSLGQYGQALMDYARFEGALTAPIVKDMLTVFEKKKKFASATKLLKENEAIFSQDRDTFHYLTALLAYHEGRVKAGEQAEANMSDMRLFQLKLKRAKAEAYLKAGQQDKSIALLAPLNTSDLTPSSALTLARAYMAAKDYKKAETTLTNALSLLPSTDTFTVERFDVLNTLINLLQIQGRQSEAELYSRILHDGVPDVVEITKQLNEAKMAMDSDDLKKAESILDNILTIYPSHPDARSMKGVLLFTRGNYQDASSFLTDSVDPEIAHGKLTALMAISQLQAGDLTALVNSLRPSVANQSTPTQLQTLYTVAAIRLNDQIEAKRVLDILSAKKADVHNYDLIAFYYGYTFEQGGQGKFDDKLQELAQTELNNSMLQHMYLSQLLKDNQKNAVLTHAKKVLSQPDESTHLVALKALFASNHLDEIMAFMATETDLKNQYQGLILQAKVSELKKEFEQAITYYQKASTQHPDKYDAHVSIFKIKKHLNPDFSIDGLTLSEDPIVNASQTIAKAIVYLEQNDVDKAQAALYEVEDKGPEALSDMASRMQLRLLEQRYYKALNAKQHEEALKYANEYALRSPSSRKSFSLLMQMHIQLAQWNEFKQKADQYANLYGVDEDFIALNLDAKRAENDISTYDKMAQYYWQNNQSDVAAAAIAKSMMQRKVSHSELGAFLEKWQSTSKGSFFLYATLAQHHLAERDEPKAIDAMQKALGFQPNNVLFLNNLAWMLQDRERATAISYAERAARLAPEQPNVLDTLGWLYYKDAQFGKALALLEKAANIAPRDSDIAEHLRLVRAEAKAL